MEIKIISRSPSRKALIEALVKFYAKELKLENSSYKLIVSTIPNLVKNDSMRGMVFLSEENSLMMGIDSRLDISVMFATVAHEMVHVKQYAKGQLKLYSKRNSHVGYTWLGKRIKSDPFNSPWEIEAYSKEVILANKVTQMMIKRARAKI